MRKVGGYSLEHRVLLTVILLAFLIAPATFSGVTASTGPNVTSAASTARGTVTAVGTFVTSQVGTYPYPPCKPTCVLP